MDKELQDLVWSILPKEFKEEVKRIGNILNKDASVMFGTIGQLSHKHLDLFVKLFGRHNLTSDAEGEEMLTVPRKTVLEMFAANKRSKSAFAGTEIASESEQINHVLFSFFGSKCLADENSSNIERLEKIDKPKYHKGQKVVVVSGEHKGYHGTVDDIDYVGNCHVLGIPEVYFEPYDLEPYTEPDTSHETPVCENYSDDTSQKEVKMNSNRNLSKDCDKQFDNILKDSFSKERRLNVAVQMIKAMMGCPEIIDRISSAVTDSLLDDILHDALHLTDRLIDECEKGGFK